MSLLCENEGKGTLVIGQGICSCNKTHTMLPCVNKQIKRKLSGAYMLCCAQTLRLNNSLQLLAFTCAVSCHLQMPPPITKHNLHEWPWWNSNIQVLSSSHSYSIFYTSIMSSSHSYSIFYTSIMSSSHSYSIFYTSIMSSSHSYSIFYTSIMSSSHSYSIFYTSIMSSHVTKTKKMA